MSRPVSLTEDAMRDIREMDDHIAGTHGPAAAESVNRYVREELRKLGELPGRGRVVDGRPGLFSSRADPTKYLVFFRVVDGEVRVVRILHGARNLGPLLRDA